MNALGRYDAGPEHVERVDMRLNPDALVLRPRIRDQEPFESEQSNVSITDTASDRLASTLSSPMQLASATTGEFERPQGRIGWQLRRNAPVNHERNGCVSVLDAIVHRSTLRCMLSTYQCHTRGTSPLSSPTRMRQQKS